MEEFEDPTESVQEHIHHAAHQGSDKLTMYVALTAAFLAALAAVTNLMSGHHSNEAMLEQIRASDNWAFYQSKGVKASVLSAKHDILAALGKVAPSDSEEKFRGYKKEQDDIAEKAKEMELSSANHLGRHLIFARGVTMFQVAIAIAAISALSRRKEFWYVSLGFGALGAFFLVSGFL